MPFLIPVDLGWPQMTLGLLKSLVEKHHFEILLAYFWKRVKFNPFCNFWPQVTSNDLQTIFLKSSVQKHHFEVLCAYFIKRMKFVPFFEIFDLRWPQMILKLASLKSWYKELHFEVELAYFEEDWNLPKPDFYYLLNIFFCRKKSKFLIKNFDYGTEIFKKKIFLESVIKINKHNQ